MNFRVLLDQNISVELTSWLKEKKPEWTINHTSEVGLSTKNDFEIFNWAQDNDTIIITFDNDFADQRSFPIGSHCGIIRLNIWPTTIEETKIALNRLLERFTDNEILNALVIIDRHKIRLRKV